MKLATTTVDFDIYTTHEERIAALHASGFKYIDLSLYRPAEMEPFMGDDWKENALRLKNYAERLGMKFVQAHSPGGNPLRHDDKYEWLLASTIRSIEVCGVLGIPNTVVHSGQELGITKEEFYKRNLDFYALLFPVMEEWGVNVLIENSAKSNMGESYFFFDGSDMKEFLQYVNHPLLHACWDTGHANIEKHQYDDIIALGDDLRALHINDNRGFADEHMLTFFGTMNLDEVMDGLLAIGYNGYFTFESNSSVVGEKTWPFKRTPWSGSNKLMEAPAFLYHGLNELQYKLGEYILKAYDCFEE